MEQNSSGGFDREQLKDVQSWRRSRSDRMLAGVCGGMGRALNVDPVLIRVVMAVLVVSGPGIIFYGAAWVLMPDEGSDRSAAQGLLGDRVRPDHPWLWPVVIGVCVFSAIAIMSSFDFGKLIPGPLVVLGLLWLFFFRRKGRDHWGHRNVPWGQRSMERAQRTAERAQRHAERHIQRAQGSGQWAEQAAQWSAGNTPPTGQPAGTQYGPAQTGTPTPPQASASERPQDRVTEPAQSVWTQDDPLGLYVDEPPPATTATATRTAAAPPVKGYRGVKPAVVLLTGAAIAIAWVSGAQTTTMLVIGLATLGLGMLLGGFLGKTLALLPLGILLAAAIAASTVFPSIPRNFAEVDFVATPQNSVDATNTSYTFDAGSVKLDLSKAVFKPGAKVFVQGGAGEVVVTLPPNVDVTGNLVTDTGQVDAFGKTQGGHDAKMSLTDLGADGVAGPQSVTLDLHLKLGSIRVVR
ncbi:PspC domain-containing protein [Streptomyces sp. SID13031]|uniref:PspC domain-containing protein n=1 Tax=Streptomyces sp. SID13031 TaxID=2706046 RepID=UPI0013CA9CDD|nr:PspC domain-containing protein [Streptomyces sp. SID13031]NEA31638.1 PspC domain-containing protein [Streptomyces sp. SID13031]